MAVLSKIFLIFLITFSLSAAVDKLIVFEGVFSGNFTEKTVEVLKYNNIKKSWFSYQISKDIIPSKTKIIKGNIVRFEMDIEEYKSLKKKKSKGLQGSFAPLYNYP